MKAIYIRTSTEDQNPENQLKDCYSLFEGEAEQYKDQQSAWKEEKERENFERLKKEISSKRITDLYVWDWDRIYRDRKKLKAFFEFCKVYKCKIHSFRQKFYEQLNNLPEPFNEIMQNTFLDLLGWLAEEESTKKSERVKIAVRREGEETTSYKGNKWGRPELNDKVDNQIIELHKAGKKINEIHQEVTYWNRSGNKKNVSVGYVHKVISKQKNG